MTLETEIQAHLKRLMQHLAFNHPDKVMIEHRALYKIGDVVIPHIRDILLEFDLTELDRIKRREGVEMRYVTGLMSLVHDINETESKRLSEQLFQGGCDPLIVNRLKSITAFTLDDFIQYTILNISIFQDKTIVTKHNIRSLIEKWLHNVPNEDLKNVNRVYILPQARQDYAGRYMRTFHIIELIWDLPELKIHPKYWFAVLFTEHVLYHEIGHHVHRTSLDDDTKPQAEDRAENYAWRLLFLTHPTFHKFFKAVWFIYWPIRFIKSKMVTLSKESGQRY